MRASLSVAAKELAPAAPILAGCLAAAGLTVAALAPDDPLLGSALAVLDRDAGAVWVRSGLGEEAQRHLTAHELGHWFLHQDIGAFADDEGSAGLTATSPPALHEVDGYSPAQRAESEANAFAAELLVPGRPVADSFLRGSTARDLARALGVAESSVVRQLALYVLELGDGQRAQPADPPVELDADQERSCRAEGRSVVLVAGPGTGKTRALVGRVVNLVARDDRAERILCLTFSRNACDEVRSRLVSALGSLGSRVGVFTLHALGLDLLRSYGERLGLTAEPLIVTRVRAMELMLELAADMELRELLWPQCPFVPLVELLQRISAWKEQLLGEPLLLPRDGAPPGPADAVALYSAYDDTLRSRGALDLSDLLVQAVRLLSGHADVLHAVQSRYDHVLVDEGQDLNPAASALLELVVRNDATLWLVGDPAQAIYGFRGAIWPPVGEKDAALRRTIAAPLMHNYRSVDAVCDLLDAFAVRAGLRGVVDGKAAPGVQVRNLAYAEAADEDAEAGGIAAAVLQNVADGAPLAEQAVLCRTNGQAAALASALRRRGVRVCTGHAAMDEPEALAAARSIAEAAHAGHAVGGFGRAHSRASDFRSVGSLDGLLAAYLFGETGMARRLWTMGDRSRRAVAWLVRFVARWEWEHARARRDTRGANGPAGLACLAEQMIADLRIAMAVGDDRVATSGSERQEALRVMTIHASKGLEFDFVFVPCLNAGSFPPRPRPRQIADPLAPEQAEPEPLTGEARLLYVALSRARKGVTVSRAVRTSRRATQPSGLWGWVCAAISDVGGRRLEWLSQPKAPAARPAAPASVRAEPLCIALADLEQYDRCPRRFAYESDRASHERPASAYVAYTVATREAVRVALTAQAQFEHDTLTHALITYDDEWARLRPEPTAARLYRTLAKRCIRSALADPDMRVGETNVLLTAEVAGATVSAFADRIEPLAEGAVIIERLKFGRQPKHGRRWVGAAVLRRAAQDRYPAFRPTVALRYLLSGAVVPVGADAAEEAAMLARLEATVARIREASFDPRPSEQCPWCPYVFACSRGREAE